MVDGVLVERFQGGDECVDLHASRERLATRSAFPGPRSERAKEGQEVCFLGRAERGEAIAGLTRLAPVQRDSH